MPAVAPFEPCILCFRGDTATGMVLDGEAEWCVAFMAEALKLGLDEAQATFLNMAADAGCDPGCVPVGEHRWGIRCCAECAADRGLAVCLLAGPVLSVYTAPSA